MTFAPDNTGYNPIARADGTYAIEILNPDGLPSVIEGFKSKAEAEEWIFQQITQDDSGLPSRMKVT